MLIHGWTRFTWKDILESTPTLQYGFQNGISVSGTVLNKSNNKPITNGVISLIRLKDNSVQIGFTDEEGRFKFDGLDIRKDTWGVFKVKNDKGKTEPSIIKLDSPKEAPVVPSNTIQQPIIPSNQYFLSLLRLMARIIIVFQRRDEFSSMQ